MFMSYQELIDCASFNGIIRFHEDERIAPLKALKFFYNRRKIELPMINKVIIPGQQSNAFIGADYVDFLVSWTPLMVKYKISKDAYLQKLQRIEGKRFYAFALNHGYDYGHHGEPTITGLFIQAEALKAAPQALIEPSSQFYNDLKKLEDKKAIFTGRGANPNPSISLEDKVRNLADPGLYSWK